MQPEDIKFGDWARMFFGQVPVGFYVELVLRGVLFYFLLVIAMRMLGKRMSSQMSRVEMTALVSLASAIGVPLLSPMNGVLPAIIASIMIVLLTRLITWISMKSARFEDFIQGDGDVLVVDGVMNLKVMKKVRITRERLFAELRTSKLNHLGAVKRVYLEANGSFSLIKDEENTPGLLLLPRWDKEFISSSVEPTGSSVCNNCGAPKPDHAIKKDNKVHCTHCGATDWTDAVTDK